MNVLSDGWSTYLVVLNKFLWILIQIHGQTSEDAFSSHINAVNLRMKLRKDVHTHKTLGSKLAGTEHFYKPNLHATLRGSFKGRIQTDRIWVTI